MMYGSFSDGPPASCPEAQHISIKKGLPPFVLRRTGPEDHFARVLLFPVPERIMRMMTGAAGTAISIQIAISGSR